MKTEIVHNLPETPAEKQILFSKLEIGTWFRLTSDSAILIKVLRDDPYEDDVKNVWNLSNNILQNIDLATKISYDNIVKRVECTFYF